MALQERWTVFTAAPHRVMMFGGALQLVATLLFWSAELIGRYSGLWSPLPTTIPGLYAHGFLMLFGLFIFFIFGFLMTTYPRWMNGPLVPARSYVTGFLLLLGGVVLYYIGLFSSREVLAAGAVLMFAGYGVGIAALWRVYRTAPANSKYHETFLNLALLLGAAGVLCHAIGVMTGRFVLLELSRVLGLWGFMIPLLLTVSHRMLPFFTSCVPGTEPVNQPQGGLPFMLGLAVGHGVLEVAGLRSWLWAVDFPLALIAAYHIVQWGFMRSFRVRLLAVLHIAFAWFVFAMLLYGLQSVLGLLHGIEPFGRAPLHALGIGFITSMTIGMATRVTLGHSGRQLELDRFTWLLFWGVSAAALLRVAAEFPLPLSGLFHPNVLAALTLLLVVLLWAARYGRMYLQRRVDGKPG